MAIPIESVNALSVSSVSATRVSAAEPSSPAWDADTDVAHTITIKNTGSVDVHLADAAVDTDSAALEPGERLVIAVAGGQEWWGLAASSTGTLRIWRN